MQRAMTIGRLASAAGVGVETIRYYQRRGLLDEPRKPFRGYRHYPADLAKRVRFIKRAQALGFTLEEVACLLRLDGADRCADTRELAAHKVASIDRKLIDLTAMRDALSALVRQCETGRAEGSCPIISVLALDGEWLCINQGVLQMHTEWRRNLSSRPCEQAA
jgi:MerR family mercuric resistance operon transcriptional regulator